MEDFVTFEISKKLKEKGFNEPCTAYYHIHENIEDSINSFEYAYDYDFYNEYNTYRCGAPTISQVVSWLLDKKKIFLTVDFEPKGFFFIVNSNITFNYEDVYEFDIFDSKCTFSKPQDAYKEGIKYIIDKLI